MSLPLNHLAFVTSLTANKDLAALWQGAGETMGLQDGNFPSARELQAAAKKIEVTTGIERPLAKMSLAGTEPATVSLLLLAFVLQSRIDRERDRSRFVTPERFDPVVTMLSLVEEGLGGSLLIYEAELVQRQIQPSPQTNSLKPRESTLRPDASANTGTFLANALLCGCSVADAAALHRRGFEGFTLRSSRAELMEILARQSEENWLTIVIPTLSKAATKTVVESIANQTEKNATVLVLHCDDTPIDYQLISGLQSEQIERGNVEVISIPLVDRGLYDAMNLGLRLASSQWIYFIGDDDELASPTVLEKIKSVLDEVPADCPMVYGNVQMVGGGHGSYDGQLYAYQFNYQKLRDKPICHQAIFSRVQALRDIGGFDLSYPVCADWDANIRLWNKGSEPVFTETTVAKFSRGGMSSRNYDALFFERLPDIWATNK